MASSPASERRAQLIREMAEDLNRTRHSLRSNSDFADLTGSHLTVEDESSQPFHENSQPLPRLPGDNRSEIHLSRRPSLDFVIDTSAIGRAFPEMTASGSSIDDGSSISIEIGRGHKDGVRDLSQEQDSQLDFQLGAKYKVDLSRLPRRSLDAGRGPLGELSTNLEQHMKSSPPTRKATTYGTSGSSRQSSAEHHRHVHPKVTVESGSDHTGSSGGKAPAHSAAIRNSLAPGANRKSLTSLPKRFTSGKDLLRDMDDHTAKANASQKISRPIVDNHTVTTTNAGTVQSFMLPNMPNMSELVSGIYDNGTPVFSRKGSAWQDSRYRKTATAKYANVPALPVPQDEEAIMLSLQLLQEKVAELERNKAEAQVMIQELQSKNQALEDKKRELRRQSKKQDVRAMSSGASDGGEDSTTGTSRATMERNRLQSQVRKLQNELEGANRRATIAEANTKNISQERDAAVSQLGAAFVTQEELKVDNSVLKEENKKLGLEIRKFRAVIETYIQRAEAERTETSKTKATEDSAGQGGSQSARSIDCQVLDATTLDKAESRRQRNRADHIYDEEPGLQQQKRRRKKMVIVEEYTASTASDGFENADELSKKAVSIHATKNGTQNLAHTTSQHERSNSQSVPTVSQRNHDTQREATGASKVSYLEDGEVTMLRKMLEKEHLERKGRTTSKFTDGSATHRANADQDITQLTNRSRSQALPRKSSLKERSQKFSDHVGAATEDDTQEEQERQSSRAPSRNSARRLSSASQAVVNRGAPSVADMTSAFIIPDITMSVRQTAHQGQSQTDVTAPVSVADENQLAAGPVHEAPNCTICTRVLGTCLHTKAGKEVQVQTPTPIPASDRIKDLAIDGDDHTMRPSESPSEALSRTIKALEDEWAHLGLQLTEVQQVYAALDPSLQRRKRKSIAEQLNKLRLNMEAKADQIYALYDVLEGFKEAGRLNEMTEKDVNDTLTSVLGEDNLENLGMPSGIMFKRGLKTSVADVTPAKERAKLRGMSIGGDDGGLGKARDIMAERPASAASAASASGRPRFPWEESYEDEDAASLPWEGFEDTINLTTGSRKSNTSSRRRSLGL